MKQEYEVGVYHAGVVRAIFKSISTVFSTWLYARRNGLPSDKWYGVYFKGTEYKVAELGCLPTAEGNAHVIVQVLEN